MHVLGQNGPLIGMQLGAKGIPRPDGCRCTATSAALGPRFSRKKNLGCSEAWLGESAAGLRRMTDPFFHLRPQVFDQGALWETCASESKTLAAHNTADT